MKRKPRLYIIFVPLLIILFSYFSMAHYSESPVGDSHITHTVDIPKGESFSRIVDILQEAGLVRYKLLFYLLAVSRNAAGRIKAGEYELADTMTSLEILQKLIRGDIKGYLVTLPEDLTLKEMSSRLAAYKLVDEKTFMRLSSDQEFLVSLGIEAETLEGFLFPDTYLLDRSMETRGVIRAMVHQFWKKVSPEMLNRAKELGLTTTEFVTLASIIGKESGNKDEKPLISAVFHNRMKKGMKLQSDPTAVYDLHNFNSVIRKKDLQNNTPHNTYLINGLPPGPIANPGLDSLEAALKPAPVEYLYFVSKNDGTHYFSLNLTAHNEAIVRSQNNKK